MRKRPANNRTQAWEKPSAGSSGWLAVGVMLALVSGGAVLWHMDLVSKAQMALETTRLKVGYSRRTHDTMMQTLANRDAALQMDELSRQKLQRAQARLDAATQQREALAARKKRITTEINTLLREVEDRILRAESAWRATELPELRLVNGKTLHAVRLGALEGGRWNLTHSEGAGMVPIHELPASLLAKFDIRSFEILDRLQNCQGRLASEIPPVSLKNASDAKLAPLRKEMTLLEGALDRLTAQRLQQEAIVRDYDQQIARGGIGSQASFSLRTQRDISEGTAGQIRSDISRLESRLNSIRAQEKVILGEK